MTASTTLVLWAPLLQTNDNPEPQVRYRPPSDTTDPRYAACTSHHPACDCREALLAELIGEGRYEALLNRRLEQATDAVLAIHHKSTHGSGNCAACLAVYPCPTRTLLAPLSWRERFNQSREDS